MPITLADLAALVDGRVVGDPQTLINAALPLRDAEQGCITLVDSRQNGELFLKTRAAAALTSDVHTGWPRPQLVVGDLHAAFCKIILHFRGRPMPQWHGVDQSAVIDATAVIDEEVAIGPLVTVGERVVIGRGCKIHSGVRIMSDCRIGDHSEIYPNVTLYPHSIMGQRVIVHAGTVVGADGFGYREQQGKQAKLPQLGWVIIEDDVEIGANVAIDRGTYGSTRIQHGTKIDNLVHIAHNCRIGPHNLICAQAGIAGSSSTGAYVVLAGQAGIADHLHLHDRAVIGAQAGIMKDVEAGQILLGSPARPIKLCMQDHASVIRLPEMRKEIRDLRRRLSQLESSVGGEEQSKAA